MIDEGLGVESGGDLSLEIAGLRARLIQSELRTEAVRAGMVDLDGIKLIDTATLPLSERGDLSDAVGVMARLKTEKPWLFAANAGRSSSSGAVAPRATATLPKTAMQMTVEEWRLARAELLRRV